MYGHPVYTGSIRQFTRSCAHGNEPSGFTKGGNFLEQLSEYGLPKMDPTL
jgi:hypothetical protein